MNALSRPLEERVLCTLLRYIGTVCLLAMVAVVMPYSWMDLTHRWLSLGPMPKDPVVGYLARSLSLFYALLGGLLWVLSFHPHRYRPVLSYLGAAFMLFGLITFGVDFTEGMPAYWKYTEGPIVILLGAGIFGLSAMLKPKTTKS